MFFFFVPALAENPVPIYDSNGFFIKYVCEIQESIAISEGRAECQKYGLDLFAILSKEEHELIKALTIKVHGYIAQENGINAVLEGGIYIARNPDPKPHYLGALPKNINSGLCLSVKEFFGSVNIDRISCSEKRNLFCEWKL